MRSRQLRALTLLTPALIAGAAMAGDTMLATSVTSGTTRLSLVGGAPFHSSDRPVLNQRVVRTGAGLVVTWEERGADGALESYFAVSRDGQRVDRVAKTENIIRLRYANFDPKRVAPAVAPVVAAPADGDVYIVQYISQPLEQYRADIGALGGTIERFLADNAQIVRMNPETRAEVAKLPYVRWIGDFHPAYKLDEPILQAITLGASGDFTAPKRYSIMTLREGEGSIDPVIARIQATGGVINGEVPETGRLEATITLQQLLEVARMNEVLFIDPWGPMETDMDIARQFFGSAYVESLTGFTGKGVRAEIFDTGVYTTHPEFSHIPIIPHGTLTGATHGTSVASIIFARGARPAARGVIPDGEAMVAANSFFDFTNRYRHHGELVDPAGSYRTVFQTNSTGSPRVTDYTTISAEMDRILFDHDMVVCQSQSNSGSLPSRPQAWSKNMLSVGGFNHRSTLTRDDDNHGGTGSTGPASDGRVKPDLSAFYDGIEAASTSTGYGQFGGTSGATPITCGHIGLFHQMWHEGVFPGYPAGGPGGSVFDSRPHMTTPKALAINTASRYPIGFADFDRFDQGWGQIDVKQLYDDREKIFVVDQEDLLRGGEIKAYEVTTLPTDDTLKITMIYPDLPGTVPSTQHRINDLSLRVTSPSGAIYWGNAGLTTGDWSVAGGSENHIDTVENVFIQDPEIGVWRVEVIASEINEDGHPATPELDSAFSLVINGGSVTPPPLLMFVSSALPDVLAPGDDATFTVDVFEGTEQLAGPPQLYYRYDGGSYQTSDLKFVSGDTWEATLPPVACGDSPEFYVEAVGDGGAVVHAPGAGAASPFTAVVGVLTTVFSENFEAPVGWTVQNHTSLTGGRWETGVPVNFGRGDPPSDYDGSGKCYLTENNPTTSNSDVDGGPTILISPIIDLSGLNEPSIEYARWYGLVSPTPNDDFDIDFSDDGGVTWTNVERLRAFDGWVLQSLRVSEFVKVNSQFRVRFVISDVPNDDIVECAIDAFSITTFGCDAGCYADCDQSGSLDFFDFLCFQNQFAAGDPQADCDGSGGLDFFDFLCFQNEFARGCP
jgi:serine protease AprX